ncbi:hypothetical protein BME39_16660 [Klebsiella quasipneumoniae subsp. similipneumoniae]|nr:hypothetical protein BME39_16660 [Klebsiella quasipneumoniae subsp. similipneumoniae]
MRAAPAFRERLSDFEAASTGSFSNHGEYINDRSHEPSRPGKAPAATRHKSGSVPAVIARWRCAYRAYEV